MFGLTRFESLSSFGWVSLGAQRSSPKSEPSRSGEVDFSARTVLASLSSTVGIFQRMLVSGVSSGLALLRSMDVSFLEGRLLVPFSSLKGKSLLPSGTEMNDVANGVNTCSRNILVAVSATMTALQMIAVSGVLSGLSLLKAAVSAVSTAGKKYRAAKKIGDTEGIVQAGIAKISGCLRGLSGLLQLNSGSINTLQTIFKITIPKIATKCVQQLGFVGNACTIVRSTLSIGSVACEWSQVSAFRNGIRQILRGSASQEAKALKGLEFLREQLKVSDADLKGIERLHLEDAAKQQSIEKKCKENHERLSRKVGDGLADEVAKQSGALIERLQRGDVAALEEATSLIERADQANFKKRVRQITLLAIGILTIVAIIISLVMLGPTSPILLAISSSLNVSLDSSFLHNKISGVVHALLWSLTY